MGEAGNASDIPEADNHHESYTEGVQPNRRTRRARIYGSFKRMMSKLWTDHEPGPVHVSSTNGSPDVSSASSELIARLNAAADGLVFMSETDAPMEVFVWPTRVPFSPEALRAHTHIGDDEPLETEKVEHFFRNVTKPQDWHEAAEQEQVRRFTALRDLIQAELTDTTVYRFGTTPIDVYVLGRAADGTTLGIHTNVVET